MWDLLNTISEWANFLTGAPAIFLVSLNSGRRRWGYILGLAAQPLRGVSHLLYPYRRVSPWLRCFAIAQLRLSHSGSIPLPITTNGLSSYLPLSIR